MTDFSYARTTMNAWNHIRVLDLTSSLTNIYWHCRSTATLWLSAQFYKPGHVPVSFSSTEEGIQKGHWHWNLCLLSRDSGTMCFKMCAHSECSYCLFTAGIYLASGSGKSVRASGSQYAFSPMAGLKCFSLCCPTLWGTRAVCALKSWCLYAN